MNTLATILKTIIGGALALLILFSGINLGLQKSGIAQFMGTETGSMGYRYPVGSVSFQLATDVEQIKPGDVLTLCNSEITARKQSLSCSNTTNEHGANVMHRVTEVQTIDPNEQSPDRRGVAGIDSERPATHIIHMQGDENNARDNFEYPVAGKVWRTEAVLPVWFGVILKYMTNAGVVVPIIVLLLGFTLFDLIRNRKKNLPVSDESSDEELLDFISSGKATPEQQLAITTSLVARLRERELTHATATDREEVSLSETNENENTQPVPLPPLVINNSQPEGDNTRETP